MTKPIRFLTLALGSITGTTFAHLLPAMEPWRYFSLLGLDMLTITLATTYALL